MLLPRLPLCAPTCLLQFKLMSVSLALPPPTTHRCSYPRLPSLPAPPLLLQVDALRAMC